MNVAKPLVLVSTLVAGCGATPTDEVRHAMPTSSELRVAPPQQATPSTYWALSEQIALQINEIVGGPLDAVGAITAQPPTTADDNGAMWLVPRDAQSPIARRLIVNRVEANHNNFQLQVKPVAAGDDAWQPFLTGSVLESGGRRAGALIVDFALLHALDPKGQPDGGHVAAEFDVGGDARLHVQLDEVGPTPTSAVGHLERAAGGGGGLELNAVSDFVAGPQRETAHVAAGWSDRGAGHAEVQVRDGDSGAGTDSLECWDAAAHRVFFTTQVVGGAQSSEGDPSACP